MKKNNQIRTVAVLGSGVMGSQIAAHLANAGYKVLLLDLKSDGADPDKIARESVSRLHRMKPAPLALPSFSTRIRPANLDDHWNQLSEIDWIIEAVVERMDVKKPIMERLEQVCHDQAIITTNTSGLPINEISKGLSAGFRRRFLGTHFFNPPRYMKLLEIIPTPDTDPEITAFMRRFCEQRLGKGVVICNDTPNFIANRIGIFSMASIMPWYFDGKLRAETIDWLTGTLTGYSKAATFRTADLAGNDVIGHVLNNLYPVIPKDERRDVFKIHSKFEAMLKAGLNGNKSGSGFYKKTKEGFLVLNPESMEYEIQAQQQPEGFTPSKTPAENLKALISRKDEIGSFVWSITRDLLLYSANRIPEISSSVPDIDRAMEWGFNWQMGPFRRWDAIGVKESVERMEKEGFEVPGSVKKMLTSGRKSFYGADGSVWDLTKGGAQPVPPVAEGAMSVAGKAGKAVIENEDAALLDGGNGIGIFEVRTRNALLGRKVVETMQKVIEVAPGKFDALVIHHDGEHFSRGANLKEVVTAIQQKEWSALESSVKTFQETVIGIRNMPIPVVMAPFGQTLGGACEWVLHGDAAVAHHETYIGLVETGVGILPAGCGTKERLRRIFGDVAPDDMVLGLERLKTEFKKIAMATLSMSANEGIEHGHFPVDIQVVMHRELQLSAALRKGREMADAGYTVPDTPSIRLLGKAGYSALALIIYIMKEARFISEHDGVVAERLAFAMTGGNLSDAQMVSESVALKLEREAFMDLLREEKTQQRIIYTLENGKPLRN